jgi:CBS domain-containing protein/gamma-glutamylcysteine synthetase
MGDQNVLSGLEGKQLRSFVRCLLEDLSALEQMLDRSLVENEVSRIGAEQEIFLVGQDCRPAPISIDLLEKIDDPHFTTELGLFNVEINLDPLNFSGNCLSLMERQLNELITKGRQAASQLGIELALTGILPTIRKSDLGLENLTPKKRYFALNEALGKLRAGPYEFHIRGLDELTFKHDSMMAESCNTSFQIHIQVNPDQFANAYNISQALAGPVLAIATNSPLLFGRRLWHETRIALFRQSIDTRSSSFYIRNCNPRVIFGNGWVKNSVLELYQEDISRFRSLLGTELCEDPFLKLEQGKAPQLQALKLHNGTIYRWNRACYGISDGKPHLRIENRILPAGPSVIDEIANSAYWLGLMNGIAAEYGDIRKIMDFEDAKMNFYSAARLGLNAQLTWFNGEIIPAQTLCTRLLPLAREGLRMKNIDQSDIDLYLGVIEQRVRSGQTGSQWMLRSFTEMKKDNNDGERLNNLVSAVISRQKEGRPVAEWKLAQSGENDRLKNNRLKVEQYMTTDLFTVNEDESIDLVINLMDWNKIRHVPVEDYENRLVGLISYRTIMKLIARGWRTRGEMPIAVSEIMKRDLITAPPETSTSQAIELMQRHKISCLPIIEKGHLVGIVTERDLMKITEELLKQKLSEEKEEINYA